MKWNAKNSHKLIWPLMLVLGILGSILAEAASIGDAFSDNEYRALAAARVQSLEDLYTLEIQIDDLYARQLRMPWFGRDAQLDALYEKRQKELENFLSLKNKMKELAPQTSIYTQKIGSQVLGVVDRLNRSGYAARCGPNEKVDLVGQFTANSRNQGSTGTCSIFGGLGIIEAAYFREYGQVVDLSEMWLARQVVKDHLAGDDRVSVDSCFVGADVDKLLTFINKSGVCSEATYPFASKGISDFESEVGDERLWGGDILSEPNLEALSSAVRMRRQQFDSTFGADSSPRVRRCQDEAGKLKSKFIGFRSICLSDPSVDELEALISVGLPLSVSSAGYRRHPSEMAGFGGSNHRYVISGYDQESQTFMVRNSWGRIPFISGPKEITYKEAKPFQSVAVGFLQNMREACALLTPSDTKRLCLDSKFKGRLRDQICPQSESPLAK